MRFLQSHSAICNAPQALVYKVICESSRWPELLEPCVAVEIIGKDDKSEHIRITALVGDKETVWESRRHFRREIFGIDSKSVKTMPLVKRMNTSWRVISINLAQCLLLLEHDYDLSDDIQGQVFGVYTHEDAAAFIANAIDENSIKDLAGVRDAAQLLYTGKNLADTHITTHSIVCNVSAAKVYYTIGDIENWPLIFDSCVSAAVIERAENNTLVDINIVQFGEALSLKGHCTYFDDILRIDCQLPVQTPYIKCINSQWRVIPIDVDRCVLNVTLKAELSDDISLPDGYANMHEWIKEPTRQFVEGNATNCLQTIRFFVENNEVTFCSFQKKYILPFTPDDVYSVLFNVALWPDILPHCDSVNIIYNDGENQEFVMQICTPRGIENVRCFRNCIRDDLSISYFQPVPPVALTMHTGKWMMRPTSEGTEIISEHVMRLNTERCREMFGEVDMLINKARIKELISKNSKATIDACGVWLKQKKSCI